MAAGLPALVATTLALPSAVPQAEAQTSTNLIPAQTSTLANSGDTGLWQAWYGDTVAQSTAQVYPGDTGSLAINATAADAGLDWSDYPGVTGAQPDTSYTLSYALDGPSGAAFLMEFNWYGSSGNLLRTDDLSAATDGTWVNPDETVTTPAGTSTLYIQLTTTNATASDTYYLDSIDALQDGGTCTDPVWNDTSSNDVNTDTYSGDSPYLLAMDMWNGTYSPITQTMEVCNHASWYVDDTVTSATNTAVLVYPNVQENYSSPISDYGSITSAFASSSSSPGDYEFTYDIWLNSYANEVMIWTDNHGQTPGGTLLASDVTISGLPWDIYATTGNGYIAFVPSDGASYSSGTFDLLAFFNHLMGTGQIATTSTLTQIDYGVEVCNTGGAEGQFNFTNFSINTSS
jgi:hypothetical protein